jgi:peroxisomal 2,4-dienoyl-CoA reductase
MRFTVADHLSSVFRPDILKGKVALITGGASGIGLQIAQVLGWHGAAIHIASRNEEKLQAAIEALCKEGITCQYSVADIRDTEAVESIMDDIINHFGRIDIVVNNAAGNFPAPISGISYNGFKSIVDIDLLGTYNITKAAFDAYLKNHGGNIINITAPFQHGGASYQAHVAAAKSGVDSLTRTCAVEFGPHAIRVNAIAPGATAATEGMTRFTSEVSKMTISNPLGFVGEKTDIANAVLFLVSDAARYITGQILSVDGGSGVDLFKLGSV